MPLPPVHHVFLQRATPEGCEERFFLDGRANDVAARHVDVPYASRRLGALEAFRGGVGWLLKNAARLIYLAPALIAVKMVLYFIDSPTSDLTIVVFVGMVVAFFALLNLYIFVSVLWWLFGRGPTAFSLKAPFDEQGRLTLPHLAARASVELGPAPEPVGQLIRARGTIVRLGPNREGDGAVLTDLWAPGSEGMRATEAADFAVIAEGRAPVVLRLTQAPVVIAKPEPLPLAAYASVASPSTTQLLRQAYGDPAGDGSLLTLREGDEVEVTGAVAAHIENVDGFEIAGTVASVPLPASYGRDGASPFRDRPGGPGVILGEAPGAPVLIRRVGPNA